MNAELFIGTAGWSIASPYAERFPGGGSHLERYARVFGAAEINTSFYRPHRISTYERWAASVPPGFRFAVKLPRAITHERRLCDVEDLLSRFLDQANALGDRLGPLLVQLPPSLAFDETVAARFFDDLRARHRGAVVCEPRHASWFAPTAERLLIDHEVARVAADPAPVPAAGAPGGWPGLLYIRLHGSPRIYHSAYDGARLAAVAAQLAEAEARGAPAWCILDNTAGGAALGNALELAALCTARARA